MSRARLQSLLTSVAFRTSHHIAEDLYNNGECVTAAGKGLSFVGFLQALGAVATEEFDAADSFADAMERVLDRIRKRGKVEEIVKVSQEEPMPPLTPQQDIDSENGIQLPHDAVFYTRLHATDDETSFIVGRVHLGVDNVDKEGAEIELGPRLTENLQRTFAYYCTRAGMSAASKTEDMARQNRRVHDAMTQVAFHAFLQACFGNKHVTIASSTALYEAAIVSPIGSEEAHALLRAAVSVLQSTSSGGVLQADLFLLRLMRPVPPRHIDDWYERVKLEEDEVRAEGVELGQMLAAWSCVPIQSMATAGGEQPMHHFAEPEERLHFQGFTVRSFLQFSKAFEVSPQLLSIAECRALFTQCAAEFSRTDVEKSAWSRRHGSIDLLEAEPLPGYIRTAAMDCEMFVALLCCAAERALSKHPFNARVSTFGEKLLLFLWRIEQCRNGRAHLGLHREASLMGALPEYSPEIDESQRARRRRRPDFAINTIGQKMTNALPYERSRWASRSATVLSSPRRNAQKNKNKKKNKKTDSPKLNGRIKRHNLGTPPSNFEGRLVRRDMREEEKKKKREKPLYIIETALMEPYSNMGTSEYKKNGPETHAEHMVSPRPRQPLYMGRHWKEHSAKKKAAPPRQRFTMSLRSNPQLRRAKSQN
eukprot:g873.t1